MEIKIVVGGQVRKQEIAKKVLEYDPSIEVEILSDIEAAIAIKNKTADYYLGSCDTGGGGALAMAISFLGITKTKTITTQSSRKTSEEIEQYISDGVVAFGFVETDYEYATNNILNGIFKLKKGAINETK